MKPGPPSRGGRKPVNEKGLVLHTSVLSARTTACRIRSTVSSIGAAGDTSSPSPRAIRFTIAGLSGMPPASMAASSSLARCSSGGTSTRRPNHFASQFACDDFGLVPTSAFSCPAASLPETR